MSVERLEELRELVKSSKAELTKVKGQLHYEKLTQMVDEKIKELEKDAKQHRSKLNEAKKDIAKGNHDLINQMAMELLSGNSTGFNTSDEDRDVVEKIVYVPQYVPLKQNIDSPSINHMPLQYHCDTQADRHSFVIADPYHEPRVEFCNHHNAGVSSPCGSCSAGITFPNGNYK